MNKPYYFILLFISFLSCRAQDKLHNFKFAPGSPFEVGSRPIDITIADINKDTKADIVVLNSEKGDINFLSGEGTGQFKKSLHTSLFIGLSTHTVESGDIDKDGYSDLIFSQHDSYNISVMLGDGKGVFLSAPGSPFPALKREIEHNHGLIIIDFNKDGFLDIATSTHNDSSVSVFLGDGTGLFKEAGGSPFSVGRGPYPLSGADFNKDGNIDIVTPNLLSSTITVLFGDGKGSFLNAAGSTIKVLERPYHTATGDINNDSNPDILISHDDINSITVLLGDGNGLFIPANGSPIDPGYRSYKMVLIDINNDKKLDLIANSYPKFVSVMLGDSNGGFTHIKDSPIEVGDSPNGVSVTDINGDGKYDIIVASTEDNNISVLLGQ